MGCFSVDMDGWMMDWMDGFCVRAFVCTADFRNLDKLALLGKHRPGFKISEGLGTVEKVCQAR